MSPEYYSKNSGNAINLPMLPSHNLWVIYFLQHPDWLTALVPRKKSQTQHPTKK